MKYFISIQHSLDGYRQKIERSLVDRMKALTYLGIREQKILEIEMPKGNFIVQILGCGVCGTDLKAYTKGHHMFIPPTILGHEFIGQVVKAEGNFFYHAGDFVVVAPYYECGECELCRRGLGQICQQKKTLPTGAFCEYIAIPDDYVKKGVFPIPDDDLVYTLTEPLACVLNGSEHLSIKENSRVLIVGSGPMGALFALLYQDLDVSVAIVEPNKTRRELAGNWGVQTFDVGEADLSAYDNIVIAVNQAGIVEECISKVADGGTVLLFSGLKKEELIKSESFSIHYREVKLTGSFGYSLSNFKQSMNVLENNKDHYRKVITGVYPLTEADDVFENLLNAIGMKAVLKPF